MAKDTSSHHVWRVLMMCLALGAGALFMVIGYMFGVRIAVQSAGNKPPQEQSVSQKIPVNAEQPIAIATSIFENGRASDKLIVTWLPESAYREIALPFVIPGATLGERIMTDDTTKGSLLGTAVDARGIAWDIIAVDVTLYDELGGVIDGASTRYFFAHNNGIWEEIPQGLNVVTEADKAWAVIAATYEPKRLRTLLYTRLAPNDGALATDNVVNEWLVKHNISESTYWIPELTLAARIAAPNGAQALVYHSHFIATGKLLKAFHELPVVATLDDGSELRMWVQEDVHGEYMRMNHYITANTYFAITENDLIVKYTLDIPFLRDSQLGSSAAAGEVTITTDDGEFVRQYSSVKYGGCGILAEAVLRTALNMNDLVVLGTSAGETLYTARNPQQSADFRSAYETWANWKKSIAAYDGTTPDTSWTTFLAGNPLFYWKNPMGNWMLFSSSEVVPLAECGKPVIYLYPPETTDINVQLYLQGGFTAAIPPYGEKGWTVTAAPDGTLLNHADGQQYPYLFWEGFGSPYPQSSYFDVVARDDVPMYLINTLWNYGLNQTEIRDFMEFWLPRMQKSRYYKISWIDTEAFNQLAPLSLSRRPDSLLRILMEYEELNEPVASNPMPTPEKLERAGFTVVEWGGVLKSTGATPQRVQ